MLSAVIAAFLYLRIIVSMFLADPVRPTTSESGCGSRSRPASRSPAALAFTLVVGFLPGWLISLAYDAVPQLGLGADPTGQIAPYRADCADRPRGSGTRRTAPPAHGETCQHGAGVDSAHRRDRPPVSRRRERARRGVSSGQRYSRGRPAWAPNRRPSRPRRSPSTGSSMPFGGSTGWCSMGGGDIDPRRYDEEPAAAQVVRDRRRAR